jgi:hypothetical protein
MALSTSTWTSAVSGNWTAAADWTNGAPPGSSANNQAGQINATGTGAYVVTINSNAGTMASAGTVATACGLWLDSAQATLDVASGGTITVGAASAAGGYVLVQAGTLEVDTGGAFAATNDVAIYGGALDIRGGVATVAALSQTAGSIEVSAGTLVISGALGQSTAPGLVVTGSGLLELGDAAGSDQIILQQTGTTAGRVYWTSATTADLAKVTLTNFVAGGTLDVATSSAVNITGTAFAGGTLTIDTSGGNLSVVIGTGSASRFLAATKIIGSRNVVEITACYLRGTRIATPAGMVAVERLRAGDHVLTPRGAEPVRWIGFRSIDCTRHARPQDVWPVRIDPHAFGHGQPGSTLRLSPDHAVLVDGVLIPIRYLINGATIVQEPANAVSYWHVELPRHGILLAEGLTCESYLDTGNRAAFRNGGPAQVLHPDFAWRVWEAEACAPLVRDGAGLEAARSWLLEQAERLGHVRTSDPALRLIAGGRTLAAQTGLGGRMLRAALPGGVARLHFLSRSFVASHVYSDSDDCRDLGVAVTRIWLDGKEVALDDPRLESGWSSREMDWRWTCGDATLSVDGARLLQVELGPPGLYWADPTPERAVRVA